MKVCILSMQRVGNMGSLLQSYALKTTIERLGHQVEFIDIEKREDDYKLLDDYKQKYDKEKESIVKNKQTRLNKKIKTGDFSRSDLWISLMILSLILFYGIKKTKQKV